MFMYSLTIYPKWTQVLFTFFLPLAWFTFYPVKDILGMKGSVISIPLEVISLGVDVIMFALSCCLFHIVLCRYESGAA